MPTHSLARLNMIVRCCSDIAEPRRPSGASFASGWPGPNTRSLTSWSIAAAFIWLGVSVTTRSNALSFSRRSPRIVFPFFTNFDGKIPVWSGAQTALSPTNVDVQPQVVAAELEHPWRGCNGLAEQREGVSIVAGGVWSTLIVQLLISGHDVEYLLIAHRAEDGFQQPVSGVPLGDGQFAHPEPWPRHIADREVGPHRLSVLLTNKGKAAQTSGSTGDYSARQDDLAPRVRQSRQDHHPDRQGHLVWRTWP